MPNKTKRERAAVWEWFADTLKNECQQLFDRGVRTEHGADDSQMESDLMKQVAVDPIEAFNDGVTLARQTRDSALQLLAKGQ